MTRDVLIVGAGPAGLSAAAACIAAGLRVSLLAPDPDAPWIPTYAAWVDEIEDSTPDVPFDVVWPEVEVRFAPGECQVLPRRYGRIDGAALRARLWDQCGGIEVLRGAVVEVGGDEAGTSAARDDRGRVHRARITVDATGTARAATAFQTAHGVFAEVDGLDGATPRWMDFSAPFGPGDEAPSFLYALPLPDGTWLLEETALVRTPAVPHDVLRQRLEQRLAAAGLRVRTRGTERVTIPMDAPDDAPTPPGAVRFGAAAGMVHPATGYLVPRVLAAAPRLARAIAEAPDDPASAARAAIWPADALRRHRIYRFGARAVAGLGADDTRAFFRAFFGMPPEFVAAYLGDRLTTADLTRGMASLFARLPAHLRWRIVAAGSWRDLVRAALAPSRPRSPATKRWVRSNLSGGSP
jgi:lycopene beta-cyclase